MILPSPITIQPPPFVNSKGQSKPFPEMKFAELDFTISDNATRKIARAGIRRCPFAVTLWDGAAYDAAGDYTQAQAEARLLEVLGPDVKAGLEALFVPPVRK
jgi:hypothetical protein